MKSIRFDFDTAYDVHVGSLFLVRMVDDGEGGMKAQWRHLPCPPDATREQLYVRNDEAHTTLRGLLERDWRDRLARITPASIAALDAAQEGELVAVEVEE